MNQLIYIGPDLIFNLLKPQEGIENSYHVIVKAGAVKFVGVVGFIITDTNPSTNKECSMSLGIGAIAGPLVSPESLSKALNCLTINSKQAGEVCCQAFLNGFLDGEF